jgi:hypothetical protein
MNLPSFLAVALIAIAPSIAYGMEGQGSNSFLNIEQSYTTVLTNNDGKKIFLYTGLNNLDKPNSLVTKNNRPSINTAFNELVKTEPSFKIIADPLLLSDVDEIRARFLFDTEFFFQRALCIKTSVQEKLFAKVSSGSPSLELAGEVRMFTIVNYHLCESAINAIKQNVVGTLCNVLPKENAISFFPKEFQKFDILSSRILVSGLPLLFYCDAFEGIIEKKEIENIIGSESHKGYTKLLTQKIKNALKNKSLCQDKVERKIYKTYQQKLSSILKTLDPYLSSMEGKSPLISAMEGLISGFEMTKKSMPNAVLPDYFISKLKKHLTKEFDANVFATQTSISGKYELTARSFFLFDKVAQNKNANKLIVFVHPTLRQQLLADLSKMGYKITKEKELDLVNDIKFINASDYPTIILPPLVKKYLDEIKLANGK